MKQLSQCFGVILVGWTVFLSSQSKLSETHYDQVNGGVLCSHVGFRAETCLPVGDPNACWDTIQIGDEGVATETRTIVIKSNPHDNCQQPGCQVNVGKQEKVVNPPGCTPVTIPASM